MNKKMIRIICNVILCIELIFCMDVVFARDVGPEETVKKYFNADMNGMRLSGKTYQEQISPLITWRNEPGWDVSFITKKAYISKIEQGTNNASVEVRYENSGFRYGDDLILVDFIEVVIFSLVKDRDSMHWKIEDPIIPPHVAPKTMVFRLEQRIAKERDRKEIEKLKNRVQTLREIHE